MGEIVGAGLLAHVPTIVLPEEERRELNEGKEITLVTGLRELRRDVFERDDYDTVDGTGSVRLPTACQSGAP